MAKHTGGASLKEGVVSATNKMRARVKFEDLDDMETDWLPVLCRNSYSNKDYCPLDIGEQVWCALDENFEDGVILGASYNDEDTELESSQDVVAFKWPDGGLMRYNRSTGVLDVIATGKVNITAGDDVTIDAAAKITVNVQGDTTVNASAKVDVIAQGNVTVQSPQIKLDSPMTICTGQLVVQGLLTWEAGMSGYGGGSGSGAQAVIRCTMVFEDGAGIDITDSDLTVQGKQFLPHYHNTPDGPSGGVAG